MIVKGITIHNTGNELSAKENYDSLSKNNQLNLCHYLIDETDVIQTISEDKEAEHTGMGYDFGNKFTVAIEVCRSQCDDELYISAQKNAIKFIKKLIKKYNLTTNDIYFHSDFNIKKRCPHKILDLYITKEEFINDNF